MRQMKTTLLATALFCAALMPVPAFAQEREWLLDAADQDAFLVFGVPETDDVGVSLWCKLGSGKVKLFFPEGSPDLKPEETADFVITVDGRAHTLKGSTSANAMTGATSIEAELPVDDPVLGELLKADRFAARIASHELTFPLVDAGLENLLKICRSK